MSTPSNNLPEDYELRYRALTMYANWLETNDPLISAADAIRMGNKDIICDKNRELSARLRDLAYEELSRK